MTAPPVGRVYLDVAAACRRRGLVSHRGRTPGAVNVAAFMRGTALSYQTSYTLIRKPWRIRQVDLDTLARICAFLRYEPSELLRWDADAPPRAHATPLVNPLTTDTPTAWIERLRQPRPGRKVRQDWNERREEAFPDDGLDLDPDEGELGPRARPAPTAPPARAPSFAAERRRCEACGCLTPRRVKCTQLCPHGHCWLA